MSFFMRSKSLDYFFEETEEMEDYGKDEVTSVDGFDAHMISINVDTADQNMESIIGDIRSPHMADEYFTPIIVGSQAEFSDKFCDQPSVACVLMAQEGGILYDLRFCRTADGGNYDGSEYNIEGDIYFGANDDLKKIAEGLAAELRGSELNEIECRIEEVLRDAERMGMDIDHVIDSVKASRAIKEGEAAASACSP